MQDHAKVANWFPVDSCALVAYTSHGQALIYSLPHLELIHTLQLQTSALTE